MSAVSNSLKHGVLFVLVILIVHFAVRNAVDQQQQQHDHARAIEYQQLQQQQQQQLQQQQQQQQLQPPPRLLQPPPRLQSESIAPHSQHPPPRPSTDADLMDYVFGDAAAPVPPPAPKAPKKGILKTAVPPPSPLPPLFAPGGGEEKGAGMSGSELADVGGCMVVGMYDNEKEMCGGKIFDGALDSYDVSAVTAWSTI